MPTQTKALYAILVAAIALLAVNMRAFVVAFGSLAPVIQQDLGLSSAAIGYVGAIPMAAFAIGSIAAPKLARRFGLENCLLAMALLLALALGGRVVGGVGVFIGGTIAISLAIALINVLIPAIIKKRARDRLSLTTGIYSMSLSLFAGLCAGAVVPLARYWGSWRMALGVWALVGALAFLLWFWLCKQWKKQDVDAQAPPPNAPLPTASVWRSPLAWWISGFLGFQALLYYTLASFLSLLLVSRGVSQTAAGQAMMLLQCVAIPSSLFLARWVAQGRSLRAMAMTASLANLVGVIGFAFLPTQWVWVMAVLVGAGCSLSFTLCLMLFGLKTASDQQTASLSGMVQALAYALAFFGPTTVGVLLAWSGDFALPMAVLVALMGLKCLCAWKATDDKTL